MTADFSEELISCYLDEELTEEEQLLVQRYLAESPEQERLLSEFQMVGELLRTLPQEPAPVDLSERIRQQIRKLPPADSAPKSGETLRHKSALFSSRGMIQRVVGWSTVVVLFLGCGLLLFFQAPWPAADQLAENAMHREMLPAAKEDRSVAGLSSKTQNSAVAGLKTSVGGTPAGAEESLLAQELMTPSILSFSAQPGQFLAETTDLQPRMPASPPIALSNAETNRVLEHLEKSPKLLGALKPGELIQYQTEHNEEVVVIELSVVDIAQTFGEVQVLLAGNHIIPRSQASPASQNEKQQSDPVVPHSEMIALYVEASESQFLQSLSQLEGLRSVERMTLGNSPRLAETAYSVTPVNSVTAPAVQGGVADEVAPGREMDQEENALAKQSDQGETFFYLSRALDRQGVSRRWNLNRGQYAKSEPSGQDNLEMAAADVPPPLDESNTMGTFSTESALSDFAPTSVPMDGLAAGGQSFTHQELAESYQVAVRLQPIPQQEMARKSDEDQQKRENSTKPQTDNPKPVAPSVSSTPELGFEMPAGPARMMATQGSPAPALRNEPSAAPTSQSSQPIRLLLILSPAGSGS